MAETILNIGNPETGERYQLHGEQARDAFMDQYKPAGYVLLDRDGGKPDDKATRELVREVNDERTPKKKAAEPPPPDKAEKA